ncbi:MAG: GHKL domain-containing protein [Lachnospiraceae bacterium]|nr:GHKL domain-containing protein [Robinsoniella sp.]MDY3766951.1 GHKL domain-containing protein [Lachnospiraceae bacterium]
MSKIFIRVSDLFTIISLLFCMMSFFSVKKQGKAFWNYFFGSVAVGFLGIYLWEIMTRNYWYYVLNFLLIGLLFSHFFLKGYWLSHVLLSIVFLSLFMQLNVIEGTLGLRICGMKLERSYLAQIVLGVCFWMIHKTVYREGWRLPIKYWLINVGCSVICAGCTYLIPQSEIFSAVPIAVTRAVEVCVWLINMLVFAGSMRLSSEMEEKSNLQIINNRLLMERQKAEEIEMMYQRASKLRHDFYNHMMVLSSMAEQEECGAIRQYLKELQTEAYSGLQTIDSGNRMIDLILNQKEAQAKNMGIATEIYAKVPAGLPIKDTDLCALLFNLIDNALEAMKHVENPWIKIRISVRKTYLCVHIANKTTCDILSVNPEMKTTKADKECHGVGKKIVDSLVKKYEGILRYEGEAEAFHVYVMLQLI